MPLRRCISSFSAFSATLLFSAFLAPFLEAQQPAGAGKALTVERIYSQPSLSGRLTRGLAWTPDAKGLSYFETKGSGKDAKTELWVMDARSFAISMGARWNGDFVSRSDGVGVAGYYEVANGAHARFRQSHASGP